MTVRQKVWYNILWPERQTMSGSKGAKGVTVSSLCGILTDAVKCRIAGGNTASVKIPDAKQHGENGGICADQLAHLVSELSRCPCNITACTGAMNRKKLQFLVLMTQAFGGHVTVGNIMSPVSMGLHISFYIYWHPGSNQYQLLLLLMRRDAWFEKLAQLWIKT